MKRYLPIKRAFDFLFASILLFIASPIIIVVSIAIKLESHEPVFFRQQRPGKKAEIFTMVKFRTMRIETEEDGEPLSDMQRMTRLGSFLRKTSIDELPQLFNVLRGEMSFIGPRPLLINYLDYYSPEQMRRHDVLPGISGWAQVNGRNAITWEEKFKLDVWYVDHIGFLLDLKICWLTLYNVLRSKDVNSSTSDTMPFFTGSHNSSKKDYTG